MAKPDHRDPDVDSALDLIVGDTPAPDSTATAPRTRTARKQEGEQANVRPHTHQRITARRAAGEHQRPKARTGRPPGAQLSKRKLKDKTSLAVDLELMDRYRKQSWKEECQLGELVERALRQYAEQTWGWRFK
jgi:hypothetical protein